MTGAVALPLRGAARPPVCGFAAYQGATAGT
jgi:hypothetical protein